MKITKLEFIEESESAVVYDVTTWHHPMFGWPEERIVRVFQEKKFLWAYVMETMELFINATKASDLADLIKHDYQVRKQKGL